MIAINDHLFPYHNSTQSASLQQFLLSVIIILFSFLWILFYKMSYPVVSQYDRLTFYQQDPNIRQEKLRIYFT